MDMRDAFMGAAAAAVPGAEVVHDRFHASAYLGKAVDSVRRGEARELRSAGDRSLVGTRYVWPTAPSNWSEAQSGAFAALAAAGLKTGRAWAAEESFRRFWAYSSAAWARRFFDAWHFRATHSRLKPLVEAARTLKRHLPGLLAYFRHRVTNAATEGLNSVIQSIKSNARGFRNFDNYRAAILFRCGKLDLLPH
jgi:transposase